MEQKKTKPTNGQLQRRIEKSPLHLERTKDTISFYFDDKGVRLTADDTEGYALIATNYHTHVFSNYTASGMSRPFIYTKRLIEIARDNDCETENGHSFTKLLETLKKKDDQTEYNIVTYIDWWITNCFQPLYSIGETEVESFLVYEDYIHNIARNAILLSEKTEDITNKQFVDKLVEYIKSFTDGIEERVIFHKKTDEEIMQENIAAIQEQESEDYLNTQANDSQDKEI